MSSSKAKTTDLETGRSRSRTWPAATPAVLEIGSVLFPTMDSNKSNCEPSLKADTDSRLSDRERKAARKRGKTFPRQGPRAALDLTTLKEGKKMN